MPPESAKRPSIRVALLFLELQMLTSPNDKLLLGEFDWRVNAGGYLSTSVAGVPVLFHRLVMCAKRGDVVDHANGNKMDNRRENLRICTHAENMRNRKTHTNNKLGVKGVYYLPKKKLFRADIRANGRRYTLGKFKTIEQAKAAYDSAAVALHGEFARLN